MILPMLGHYGPQRVNQSQKHWTLCMHPGLGQVNSLLGPNY